MQNQNRKSRQFNLGIICVTHTLKLVKFDCAHPLTVPKHDLALKRKIKSTLNIANAFPLTSNRFI